MLCAVPWTAKLPVLDLVTQFGLAYFECHERWSLLNDGSHQSHLDWPVAPYIWHRVLQFGRLQPCVVRSNLCLRYVDHLHRELRTGSCAYSFIYLCCCVQGYARLQPTYTVVAARCDVANVAAPGAEVILEVHSRAALATTAHAATTLLRALVLVTVFGPICWCRRYVHAPCPTDNYISPVRPIMTPVACHRCKIDHAYHNIPPLRVPAPSRVRPLRTLNRLRFAHL
jgi:hypothetical protein